MSIIDFQNWTVDGLKAYATILSLFTFVLGLTLVFRRFGLREAEPAAGNGEAIGGIPSSRGDTGQMEVIQIRDLADGVRSFRLKPEPGKFVSYEPGQFLTFYLGEDGEIPRCYSLSSSPSRIGTYEVAVKRLEGGVGSGWMHDRVKVGDRLQVTDPSGRFTLKCEGKQTVLVAGGIGVTPMLSMLKSLVDSGSSREVYFFYAARHKSDLAYWDELKVLSDQSRAVRLIPVLSRPDDAWQGLKGHLEASMFEDAGVRFSEAELYTCGPAGLMDSVRDAAVSGGMPVERFHSEVFASPASHSMEQFQCWIVMHDDGRQLEYNSTKSILEFLEENGVDVPSTCRAGVCGTCEIRVASGDVQSLPSDFLSDADQQSGACLSCISWPRSDLTLET